MTWLLSLDQTNPTAQAIALIALVCMVGMALGSLKVRGIGLGTAGVLFAGILFGHLTAPIDHATLEFVKELGLILFVYCLGLQLGPGFLASLRRLGLRLNVLAATVVVAGAMLAPALGWLAGIDSAAVLGLFSGANTNTPSLGAAQQTLAALPDISEERAALPALAYAVSYPTAILGIIGTILVLKSLVGINARQQAEDYEAQQAKGIEPLVRRTLVVDNPNLDGVPIDSVPGLVETGVVVSRIQRVGETSVQTATGDTLLQRGDHILAVGTAAQLDRWQLVVGRASTANLMEAPGAVTHRRVVVTNNAVLGKTVQELALDERFGVTVTRVTRVDLEMTAVPNLQLQFGDVLQVVGEEASIRNASEYLGNSVKALNETHFVPLFAGIVVGIALGTLPLSVPGLPQPVRLGLAGGPLIVAILVSRLGRIGPLVWHMPQTANLAVRELGIALFFASVGLLAGPRFFAVAFSTVGLAWMAVGICLTVLPIFVIGMFALKVWSMNFVIVSGLIAGSMTDPPALAFATNICGAETPSVAYATVFPSTTLMRILSAQILAVVLCG
ncbi:MAG: putative transporter [Gemmataceae bacterium]|nr:putative transporter [Gemmataceae bacterium]